MNGLQSLGALGIVGGLIGIVIAIFIAAGVLLVATRLVAGFFANYWRMCLVVIVAGIASWVVAMVLGFVVGHGLLGRIVNLVVGVLIGAFFLNLLVKRPDGAPIGFGRAVAAEVIYYVFFVILALVIGAIFAGAGMALMHQGM
jgi:hypothetical protein